MTIQFPESMRPLFQPTADDGGPVMYRAFHGGRGSAKSHGMNGAAVIKGAQRPMRILCTREIQRSIKESSKRLMELKIQQYGLGSFYRVMDSEIRGRNGTLIMFSGLKSSAIENIKSTEGVDLTLVGEAKSVSQLSLETLGPTVMREAGSEIWYDWNPSQPTDPIDIMFRGKSGPPPGSIVREVNYPDNPFFPENLRRMMEDDKRRDYAKYQHIWLGKYRKPSAALVFKNWIEQDFETPEGVRFYFGADWGHGVDPSVLIRCWIDGRNLYVDQEAYAVGETLDNLPRLFAGDPVYPDRYPGVPGARAWPIVGDSSRPETIEFMNARGFTLTPSVKGAGSVEDGIEFLSMFNIIVHPRCTRTIAELGSYSWKVDPKIIDPVTREPMILPALDDKNNHVIDALRYAVEGERRGGYDMDGWA